VNLTIKNIPETIYKSLRDQAARQGRSLNSQAIQALSLSAQEAERRKEMRATRADLERFVASLPPMPDSVPLIRADRRSH
jgi:plasmid stability protein